MKSHSGDDFSFLNWLFFILLIYAIFLVINENMMNLILIPMIIPLLGIQITIFFKTKTPQQEHASIIYNHTGNENAMERFKQENMRYKRKHQKDILIYYSIFFIPILCTLLSLYSIVDLNWGISFFISAIISTVLMVILIKVFDIGKSD